MSTRKILAVLGTAIALVLGLAGPVAVANDNDADADFAVVVPRAPQHWDPLTDSKWDLGRGQAVMTERGTAPPGPRRPFEYAVVATGPELGSLSYRATVRIDEPVTRNDRDVVLIWNYQSPTRFYYAHLSQDNTIYPHNGIFVVNDADRLRIDDQWNGTDLGAPPAITDTDWHDVRLDYDADSGRVEVYVDGSREPLMTATDTSFAGGRVGFGSFDNYGRIRDVFVVGDRA
jgi:YD repeat-containing protein